MLMKKWIKFEIWHKKSFNIGHKIDRGVFTYTYFRPLTIPPPSLSTYFNPFITVQGPIPTGHLSFRNFPIITLPKISIKTIVYLKNCLWFTSNIRDNPNWPTYMTYWPISMDVFTLKRYTDAMIITLCLILIIIGIIIAYYSQNIKKMFIWYGFINFSPRFEDDRTTLWSNR